MNLIKIKNQLSKFNTMIIKGNAKKLEKYKNKENFAFVDYMDLFKCTYLPAQWATKEARLQNTLKWLNVTNKPLHTQFDDPLYGHCELVKVKSMFEFSVRSELKGLIDFNILKLPVNRPIFRLINA